MRCRSSLLAAAVVALALAPLAAWSGITAGTEKSGAHLEASLAGDSEVPGPGDPDFSLESGELIEVDVFLNARKESVCFDIDLDDRQEDLLDAIVAAHIHAGPEGVADEDLVVIDLDFPNQGLKGCVRAGRELLESMLDEIDDIVGEPDEPKVSNFYLHLHTSGFPTGAVRGQLEKR